MGTYDSLTGSLIQFNQNYPFTYNGNLILDESRILNDTREYSTGKTSGSLNNPFGSLFGKKKTNETEEKKWITFVYENKEEKIVAIPTSGIVFIQFIDEIASYFDNYTIRFVIETNSNNKGVIWEDRSPIFRVMHAGYVVYEIGLTSQMTNTISAGMKYYNYLYESFNDDYKHNLLENFYYITQEYKDNVESNKQGTISFSKTFSTSNFKSGKLVIYSPKKYNGKISFLTDFQILTDKIYSGEQYKLQSKIINIIEIPNPLTVNFATERTLIKSIDSLSFRHRTKLLIDFEIESDEEEILPIYQIDLFTLDFTVEGKEPEEIPKPGEYIPMDPQVKGTIYIPSSSSYYKDKGNILLQIPSNNIYKFIKYSLINTIIFNTKEEFEYEVCHIPNIWDANIIKHYPDKSNDFYYQEKIIDVNLGGIDQQENLKFPKIENGNTIFNYIPLNTDFIILDSSYNVHYDLNRIEIYDVENYRKINDDKALKAPNTDSGLILFNYLTSGADMDVYDILYDKNDVRLYNPENPNEIDISDLNYPEEVKDGIIKAKIGDNDLKDIIDDSPLIDLLINSDFDYNFTSIQIPFPDFSFSRLEQILNLSNKYSVPTTYLKNSKDGTNIFKYYKEGFISYLYNYSLTNNTELFDYEDKIPKYLNYPEITNDKIQEDQAVFRYNDIETRVEYFNITDTTYNIDWYEAQFDHIVLENTLLMQFNVIKSPKNYNNSIIELFKFYNEIPFVDYYDIDYEKPVLVYNPEDPTDIIDYDFPKNLDTYLKEYNKNLSILYTSDSDKQNNLALLAENIGYYFDQRNSIKEYTVINENIPDIIPTIKYPIKFSDISFDKFDKYHDFLYGILLYESDLFIIKTHNYILKNNIEDLIFDPEQFDLDYYNFPINTIQNENDWIARYADDGLLSGIIGIGIIDPDSGNPIGSEEEPPIAVKDPEDPEKDDEPINTEPKEPPKSDDGEEFTLDDILWSEDINRDMISSYNKDIENNKSIFNYNEDIIIHGTNSFSDIIKNNTIENIFKTKNILNIDFNIKSYEYNNILDIDFEIEPKEEIPINVPILDIDFNIKSYEYNNILDIDFEIEPKEEISVDVPILNIDFNIKSYKYNNILDIDFEIEGIIIDYTNFVQFPDAVDLSINPFYNSNNDFNISLFNYDEEDISHKFKEIDENLLNIVSYPSTIDRTIAPVFNMNNENDLVDYFKTDRNISINILNNKSHIIKYPLTVDRTIIPVFNMNNENDLVDYFKTDRSIIYKN